MRRALLFVAVILLVAVPLEAQIGRQITLRAGTPEDKAIAEIYAAPDAAGKLALLEKFLTEFAGTEKVQLAYEIYIAHYLAEKNTEKVFEYGDKMLALDPDNFNTAMTLFRAALEKNDAEKTFAYGERVGQILERFKASGPPEGVEAATWPERKAETLEEVQGQVSYVEGTLLNLANQNPNPNQKAAVLERFVAAFPSSQYSAAAEALVAATYQQMQQFAKMQEFGQKVLSRDPNNVGMLLLLADFWSERGEQLDKAEEYAKKVPELVAKAEKPKHLADEQWAQQKAIQQGLGNSILGQVHIHKNRNTQAVEAFRAASPLLKADRTSYARNLYRLGFTLAKMQRIPEARTVLTEAVSIDSPYRALAQDILNRISGPIRR